jgi:hypothetical protein
VVANQTEIVKPKSYYFTACHHAANNHNNHNAIAEHNQPQMSVESGYVLVPKGSCWIEVDRRIYPQLVDSTSVPVDSNTLGPVPLGLVVGRPLAYLVPPALLQRRLNRDQLSRVAFI